MRFGRFYCPVYQNEKKHASLLHESPLPTMTFSVPSGVQWHHRNPRDERNKAGVTHEVTDYSSSFVSGGFGRDDADDEEQTEEQVAMDNKQIAVTFAPASQTVILLSRLTSFEQQEATIDKGRRRGAHKSITPIIAARTYQGSKDKRGLETGGPTRRSRSSPILNHLFNLQPYLTPALVAAYTSLVDTCIAHMSNSTAAITTPASSTFLSTTFAQAQTTTQDSAQSSFSSVVASSVSSEVFSSATQVASTVTVEPSSTNVVTSVVSASSRPPSTQLITSVVTESASNGGSSNAPVTVVVTSVYTPSTTTAAKGSSASSAATSSSSAAGSLPNGTTRNGSNNSHGLSTGGKTAIAVVVPVVVVALLVLAGLFFWRKRKQGKIAKEERRKEVEEYGYNPNNDPTLPVVAADGSEMAEDSNGGYRGWGNTSMSNRKASTTLSGGQTAGLSDTGSQPGGFMPGSPTGNNFSDGHSGDTLMNQRETFSSDDLGALGAAPVAGAHRNNNDIRPSVPTSRRVLDNRTKPTRLQKCMEAVTVALGSTARTAMARMVAVTVVCRSFVTQETVVLRRTSEFSSAFEHHFTWDLTDSTFLLVFSLCHLIQLFGYSADSGGMKVEWA
ncbi:hypothetical protein KCU87_g260, partial [Aureobasidium melanogenum]